MKLSYRLYGGEGVDNSWKRLQRDCRGFVEREVEKRLRKQSE
nr:MAG TPA: RNA polymerase-like protein [Caudoviricetes sp.]